MLFLIILCCFLFMPWKGWTYRTRRRVDELWLGRHGRNWNAVLLKNHRPGMFFWCALFHSFLLSDFILILFLISPACRKSAAAAAAECCLMWQSDGWANWGWDEASGMWNRLGMIFACPHCMLFFAMRVSMGLFRYAHIYSL